MTLAAADLAPPQRQVIEEAVPVTGTLNPLERTEIRARLEGDLLGVFVREGEAVRAGQLLARFEEEDQAGEARSARADVAAARSELGTAEWNLEQTRELYQQGAVPQRDLRLAEQGVVAARARLTAAESRLQSTGNRLTETRVVAPASGIVERRLVNPGERVSRGATLFTLVHGDVLELTGAVPERSAARVRVGQTVRFTADGRSFEGRVARVNPSVDPATRAVNVYVQIPNPGGALKAGTFATGRIVSRLVSDALVVPMSAIREGGAAAEPVVYRVVDGKIDMAKVKVGVVDEARGIAQVVEGVSEGDQLVVGNVGMLGQGMQVRMAGAGGGGGRGGGTAKQ